MAEFTSTLRMKLLGGKVAIVTGGASGIGEATARLFADHGANAIVIADIQDEKGATVAESIGCKQCSYVHCDVSEEQQVKAMVDWTIQTYGQLDIMFSNAGIVSSSNQTILDLDFSQLDRLFEVNIRGAAACVKHAARVMVERRVKGSIVCTASVAASRGGSKRTDYIMSKHAVLGLVRSASQQLGMHGIRVSLFVFKILFLASFFYFIFEHLTDTKLITFHGDLPYPSCELIEKIGSLDEEDVVGAGGYGTVYRMVMNDCGTFAVKRIDRSREGCDQVFERELEILGSIKHINLVNLRGYCRLPTAKLLIYDYVAMGSLDSFLHDHGEEDKLLNWNARLRIALGSARGLAYLHHDCCPKIVHRDIKSSNILLDESLEPHVSDFGLAKLLVDEDAHVTTVVAGTFGYLAPEYLQSGIATEKSDVYSFGVLLLELVTGKRPTDPTFVKHGLNVVGWMNIMVRDKRLEDVVDKRCIDADVDTVEAILETAARCTDANPDDRPSMHQVLQFLEQEVMSPCPSDFYESHSDYS